MDVLDLFRGAGGWSVACQRLGLTDWGVEIMREANATAELAGHKKAWNNVWHTPPSWPEGWRGLIASPPCQTFSQAGKGNGRKALDAVLAAIVAGKYDSTAELADLATETGDERTALVLAPLHYWRNLRPDWVAFEQVPTVLPVWEACADEMRAHGYSVWTGTLQAEQYGVPQTRKRAFLIASHTREVGAPTPTHSRYYPRTPEKLDPDVKPWVSMAEALGWGLTERPSPTITGGGTETGGAEPIAKLARYTSRADWIYRSTTMANSAKRPIDHPAPTIAFGHDAASARWVYRGSNQAHAAKRRLDQPAPTVNFAERANKVEWMPEEVAADPKASGIRVTVQEAGVLQSFPADYPWQGVKTK